jgi:PKHD-type hydroxylase
MFISRIENILSKEKIARVITIIEKAEFVNGLISGGSEGDKKNLELSPESEDYIEVLNIVERAARENVEFNLTAFPRYMTRPIISRYDHGMFYKEHVDFPIMNFMSSNHIIGRGLGPLGNNYTRSDLSMTLFLSDAESYDGGYLTFEGPVEPIRMKLNAGSAVLYPTGCRHSVSTVTRGVRYAAIFWIQSLFPSEAHRQAIYNTRQLVTLLAKTSPNSEAFNMAQDNFYNLCRILADV